MKDPVLPLADKPAHMERVRERWDYLHSPAGEAMLKERAGAIGAHLDPATRAAFVRQARDAKTTAKRVMWLRKEADVLSRAAAGHSACHAGCSHCCHIGVTMTEAEARVIAAETGRKLAEPPAEATLDVSELVLDDKLSPEELQRWAAEKMAHAREWTVDRWFGVACTFLSADETCSIYASRPLACRLQVNVDADALLCRLVPGNEQSDRIRVPYADTRSSQAASVAVLGPHHRLADLRDWFPPSS